MYRTLEVVPLIIILGIWLIFDFPFGLLLWIIPAWVAYRLWAILRSARDSGLFDE